MKRRKVLFCFILLFGIIFIPFFSGCKKDDKIELNAPMTVNYQLNEETGKQIIYTQSNPFASSYLFGITENPNAKVEDFIKYTTENNYLDVTDLFVNAKTYYFYAQYIGTEKYVSSKPSEIFDYTIKYKLATPYITLDNTTINWSPIENADGYSIYSKIGAQIALVDSTSNTTFDIANDVNKKISNGIEESISYYVVATSQGNYLRSNQSNEVSYFAFLQLDTPTGLQITKSGSNFYLQWKEIEHCDNYILKINQINEINVKLRECIKSGIYLKYDITTYFEEIGLGEYSFAVKANTTNNYIQSSFSNQINYTHTQKLSTPSSVVITDQNPYIVITWNEIANANHYVLYYSDASNNYALKKYVVNNGGVEGLITTNTIVVPYEQLNISYFSEIKNNRFLIQVKAKGYGYYLDSDLSTSKIVNGDEETISAPHITDNASLNTISWNQVTNAVRYKVVISSTDLTRESITTNTYFNYADFVTNSGRYQIKCYAINAKYNISDASNIIIKEIFTTLQAPILNDIVVEDSYFVLDFTPSQNANTYSLYVGNNLLTDQITTQNKSVLITDALSYKSNNEVEFALVANAVGYYSSSTYSNSLLINTKLATPQISISNNNKNLTWNQIKYATCYTLILDDIFIDIDNAESLINLQDYVSLNCARQVRLQAKNPYFEDSEISESKYYNRADQNHAGYTDRYFYYGQTYDYYITSQQEMADVVEYTFLNRLTSVNIYVNYNSSTNIRQKVDDACSLIVGTKHYTPYCTNGSSKTGEATLEFEFAKITEKPTYNAMYTQNENDMVYVGEQLRDSDYQFDIENCFVSQDVWTTDGLLSAVQHKATPHFMNLGSIAEQVYNNAKQILLEICNDQMTDYQKALAIHDYLVENIAYDTQGLNEVNNLNLSIENSGSNASADYYIGRFHYIEGALIDGLAVCDGYAKSYALLCNMENIDCIVISGLVDKDDSSSGHAWNKIYFDYDNNGEKEWFAVDCTHDDLIVNETKQYLIHSNFLIPDSYLSARSESKDNYPVAELDSEKFYSYFKYDGAPLKITTEASLMELITYANTHNKFKLELLVPAEYLSYLSSPIYAMYITFSYGTLSYKYNQNYRVVYAYK